MAVNTYYFDGHVSITDPYNTWSNDANGFNGSLADVTTCSTSGSVAANYLQGIGTTAPLGSEEITQVRFRTYGNSFTDYVTLSAPSGGWTWEKLQGLASRSWVNPASEGNSPVHTTIFDGDNISGLGLGSVTQSLTPNGFRIIEIEVTTVTPPSKLKNISKIINAIKITV